MKGRRMTVHTSLENKVLNSMGRKKTSLLTHETIYLVNTNADIEETIRNCLTCLNFQAT